MSGTADKEDRTEAPSARRLQQAREDGDVASSRELGTLAALGCGIAAMLMTGPDGAARFAGHMRRVMEGAGRTDLPEGGLAAAREMLGAGAQLAAPVMLAALLGSLAATLGQTGLLFRTAALLPQPGRLNPMRGLKRILGGENLVETGKALAKLLAFALALRHVLEGLWPVLLGSVRWDVGTLASRSTRLVLHGALLLLGVQAAIAVLDVVWVRHRRGARLRMSRQELRDEHRQTEGDPHVKGRIRALRRQRAKRRLRESVPKATVVVTNPTHYAVALFYEEGGAGAPRVVAKGVDEMAARIRELATDHRVPIVPNPPLARALYTVPLDAEIPREHFQVVAGIIAYVWRLKRPAASGAPVL